MESYNTCSSDWLLPLGTIFSRFIHIVRRVSTSFLFLIKLYSIVWIHQIFIYLFVHWWTSGLFPRLRAIINSLLFLNAKDIFLILTSDSQKQFCENSTKNFFRTCLVARWIRIHLLVRVPTQVWGDSSNRRATKPEPQLPSLCLEPSDGKCWACVLKPLQPEHREPISATREAIAMSSLCPTPRELLLLSTTWESPCKSVKARNNLTN